jgi:hypothetical protein
VSDWPFKHRIGSMIVQTTKGDLPPQLTMLLEMIKKQMADMGIKKMKKGEVQLVLRLCKVNAQGKVSTRT